MKPFAALASFLKKNAEKNGEKIDGELPEFMKFNEPNPQYELHELRKPLELSPPSCFDFLKKENRRFNDNLLRETLLVHKFLGTQEELIEWLPEARESALKSQFCYEYVTNWLAAMEADEERFKEVLTDPNMDKELAKNMVEFNFGKKFLKMVQGKTMRNVKELNKTSKALEKKRDDALENLEHFWMHRKDQKSRIWFWQ